MDKPTDTVHTVTDAAASAADQTVGRLTATFVDFIKTYFTWENLFKMIGAVIVIVLIQLLFMLIKQAVKRLPQGSGTAQQRVLLKKAINYASYAAVFIYILSLFGIKLSALWGAAGIAGVAVGFAAQTSVSNLISGLFVLGEKTLKIGDYISVGGQSGTVDSIDLLSIKIHTPDNQMIRIPNATIINSNFVNNNFYGKRRMTFAVSIAYDSDMQTALDALLKVPAHCPSVLPEPAAAAWFDGFGESGINMTLAVWFRSEDLRKTKNEVFIAMKKLFDEAGIAIPFSRLDVSFVGDALPLRQRDA